MCTKIEILIFIQTICMDNMCGTHEENIGAQ